MARKPNIAEEELAKLGAKRLAALLAGEARRNRLLRRDLELALEAKRGIAGLVVGIRKRLTVIARSHADLQPDKTEELVGELVRLKTRILTDVADRAPDDALDLLWQFIDLHGNVIERAYDQSGRVGSVFRDACAELGEIVERASPKQEILARQVFAHVMANPHGVLDTIVKETAIGLGAVGLGALQKLLLSARDERLAAPGGQEPQTSRRYDRTLSTISLALRDIADCQGDVDAYRETYSDRDRSNPAFATEIALRLVAANRGTDALAMLDAATPSPSNRFFREEEWTAARIITLEKLGRAAEAQAQRWRGFEKFLSRQHLRDYLKQLKDFDDVEAEEKALKLVEQHASFHDALAFLIEWPALDRAAKLVETRASQIDGDRYELLNPAAMVLEGKHPLAGALLRRAMISFTLTKGRSSRYRHAARHALELAGLDAAITSYGRHEPHAGFMARLKREHARKHGFWSQLA